MEGKTKTRSAIILLFFSPSCCVICPGYIDFNLPPTARTLHSVEAAGSQRIGASGLFRTDRNITADVQRYGPMQGADGHSGKGLWQAVDVGVQILRVQDNHLYRGDALCCALLHFYAQIRISPGSSLREIKAS